MWYSAPTLHPPPYDWKLSNSPTLGAETAAMSRWEEHTSWLTFVNSRSQSSRQVCHHTTGVRRSGRSGWRSGVCVWVSVSLGDGDYCTICLGCGGSKHFSTQSGLCTILRCVYIEFLYHYYGAFRWREAGNITQRFRVWGETC